MYCDVPKLTRCCFCLPLRRGILAVAYINLIISILASCAMSYFYSLARDPDYTRMIYRGNMLITNAIPLIILAVLDIIFNLVLVIGGHTKSILLMKVYFYYGISTTVASVLLNFLLMGTSWLFFVEEFCILFAGIAFHVYILILVRSEYLKLETSQPVHYINQLSSIIVSNDQCDQVNLIPSADDKLAVNTLINHV